MIPGLPNPWLILGVLLALLGVYITGDHNGYRRSDLTWKAAEADATAKQHAIVKAKDDANQALKDKADATYLQSRQDVDAAYARGLKSGKLRDKGGQCVGVSQSTSTAGNTADGAAGCTFSTEAEQFLRDLARDADLAALYAQAGHALATGH